METAKPNESSFEDFFNKSIDLQNFIAIIELEQLIHQVRFASGIFLCITSLITVAANVLVLWNIRRQTRKCFKAPTIYFIIGYCLTGLLTALLVEPLIGLCYLRNFKLCRNYLKASKVLPPLLINLSFFVVLLLSWVQYLAISHPYMYKKRVTKTRVISSEIFAMAYSTIFSVLPYLGVPNNTVHMIDVVCHSTLVPILLLISYLAILMAVYRHAQSRIVKLGMIRLQSAELHVKENESKEGKSDSDFGSEETPKQRRKIIKRHSSVLRYVERQFVTVNLCLIVLLLLCTLPSIVVSHLTLHWKRSTLVQELQLSVAITIANDFLFLKFVLDPLIFALSFRKLKEFSKDWGYCCF